MLGNRDQLHQLCQKSGYSLPADTEDSYEGFMKAMAEWEEQVAHQTAVATSEDNLPSRQELNQALARTIFR